MSRLERIVAACGGELFDGGRRALIPGPGHSVRDRSVSLIEGHDGYIFISCFSPKDDWRKVRASLKARGLLLGEAGKPDAEWASEATPSQTPNANIPRVRAERFWREARAIAGTCAERYLKRRAISDIVLASGALRFHPSMTSLEDRERRPALLSGILDPEGALQGVEITLLSAHGAGKAALAQPRRIVGKMMGGAIRLSSPEDTLLVAEGMESAASASAEFGLPAWALMSARNLSLFNPPPTIKRLIVAMDNDQSGRAAFAQLHRRLGSSCDVECAPPPKGFKDWNDYARAPSLIGCRKRKRADPQ